MNKKLAGLLAFVCCTSCNTKRVEEEAHYEPDWESLTKYEVPQWWEDAKFGIYFHWGPYSVPAHETEWYSIHMYKKGHPINKYHEEKYGDLKTFGYKDFIPQFTGEKFDANKWAALFKKAGAKFAGPIAEHADGFAMWDSELTKWDAKDMGPKRDIVGELEKAIRKQDMKFIVTYHRHWLYAWYPTWDESTDASDPQYADLYGPKVPEGTFVMAKTETNPLPDKQFNDQWLARLDELVTKYNPDVVWFDNKMDIIHEDYRKQFLADYYNHGIARNQEVVCTYKSHDMAEGSAVLDLERSRMSNKTKFPWLTDDSIDWKAWCNIDDPNYKTTNRLIDFLVDVVSKNGAVLLNITPRADGTIPQEVEERLLQMGDWLKLNGEAIYGSRTFDIYGEGPQKIVEGHLSEHKNSDAVAEDIRFTVNNDKLYAISLDWPEGDFVIKSFAKGNNLLSKDIKSIKLIGNDKELEWEITEDALVVRKPQNQTCDYAHTLAISFVN